MNIDELRKKALERTIDGPYSDLAKEVRYLLGWVEGSSRPYLTSRMAYRKTGVNYSTIAAMSKGDRGSYESVRKFAEGLGGDVDQLLLLAGYVPTEAIGSAPAVSSIDVQSDLDNTEIGLHYISWFEMLEKQTYGGYTRKFTQSDYEQSRMDIRKPAKSGDVVARDLQARLVQLSKRWRYLYQLTADNNIAMGEAFREWHYLVERRRFINIEDEDDLIEERELKKKEEELSRIEDRIDSQGMQLRRAAILLSKQLDRWQEHVVEWRLSKTSNR